MSGNEAFLFTLFGIKQSAKLKFEILIKGPAVRQPGKPGVRTHVIPLIRPVT